MKKLFILIFLCTGNLSYGSDGLFSFFWSTSDNSPQTNHTKSLYKILETIDQQQNKTTNSIYSSMGPLNCLKILFEIAPGLRSEISNFLGTNSLNDTMDSNIDHTKEIDQKFKFYRAFHGFVNSKLIEPKNFSHKNFIAVTPGEQLTSELKNLNTEISLQTNGKIPFLIEAEDLSDENFALLFVDTLYIKADWLFFETKSGTLLFQNRKVSTLESTSYFDIYQTSWISKTTFIELPTYGNGRLLIRHNSRSVKPITKKEVNQFDARPRKKRRVYIQLPLFNVTSGLDLKNIFTEKLPQSMGFFFKTDLAQDLMYVSQFTQKLNFEVGVSGIEGSCITKETLSLEACGPVNKTQPIEVKIDSPFSFLFRIDNVPVISGKILNI